MCHCMGEGGLGGGGAVVVVVDPLLLLQLLLLCFFFIIIFLFFFVCQGLSRGACVSIPVVWPHTAPRTNTRRQGTPDKDSCPSAIPTQSPGKPLCRFTADGLLRGAGSSCARPRRLETTLGNYCGQWGNCERARAKHLD